MTIKGSLAKVYVLAGLELCLFISFSAVISLPRAYIPLALIICPLPKYHRLREFALVQVQVDPNQDPH